MSKRPDPIFASEFDAIADIERLRLGYTQTGSWSLAQVAWHCWTLTNDVLNAAIAHPPTGATPTLSAEQAKAQAFIDDVNANGWPAGPFEAPPGSSPSPDIGDGAIDDLVAMLKRLAYFPHPRIEHAYFGPVEIGKFRTFVLIHLAHHLAFLTPTTLYRRTNARYADFDAMIADIAHLRRGYTKGGNWSLAQICWHLNLGLPWPLEPQDAQEPLTEAQVARQARWDHYIAHGHAPAGFEAPGEMIPPTTANDADIDALVQRLHDLRDFKAPFIRAAAGVMPIARARGFLLAHGWLHLSCLHPIRRKRVGLAFATPAGVIADVQRLRKGYVGAGRWTLEQICWHLAITLPDPPIAADAKPDTAAQRKAYAFFETFLNAGGPPPGFEAPPQLVPPASPDASAIDDLIRRFEQLATFDGTFIQTGVFGVVETERYLQLSLGHAAHHLAYVRPVNGPRFGLRFANEDEVIADIRRLRQGYEQTGGWSLPQICWHLNQTMQARMRPGPYEPDSPEQLARKPLVERIMASGELPKGIVAPPIVSPPADAGEEAVDACLATLELLKTHKGFAPHRLFGTLPDEVARTQNLIHVAHHLSHLVPARTTTKPKQ